MALVHRVRSLPLLLVRTRWRQFLLCCFFAIFGLRAFVIERYGASIPWVDEWEATGEEILLPWSRGELTFDALIEAHNGDHRILATRVWEILWYELNGTWDPKLVMIAKATIYAAAATLFIHLFTHALPRRRIAAAALLAALFAFPFNFHNLLWAFQSQFDFFLLCVASGWLALQKNRPAAALIIAGVSLFTLGAGAILAASYVPFCLWAWVEKRWSLRKTSVVTGAALALAVIGVSLRADHAAPLQPPAAQAKAVAAFLSWPHSNLVALVDRLPETARLFPGRVLNFPSQERSWLLGAADFLHAHPVAVTMVNALFALLMLAPAAALLLFVLKRRIRGPAVSIVLGLAGFAFLMQVATGIARANEVGIPVRYVDVVALSCFAAMAAAFALSGHRPKLRPLMMAWAAVVAPAVLVIMAGTLSTIRQKRSQTWLENVRQYFPSHDHAIFHAMIAKDPEWSLPFISRDIANLMAMLDNPAYLTIAPRSVVAPDEPPRAVARAASVIAGHGLWIVLISVGAGVWIVFRLRRVEQLLPAQLGPPLVGANGR